MIYFITKASVHATRAGIHLAKTMHVKAPSFTALPLCERMRSANNVSRKNSSPSYNNSCERIIHCYTALVEEYNSPKYQYSTFLFHTLSTEISLSEQYSFVITRSHCLNKASAMQKQYSINPSRIPTQSRCQLVSRVNTRVKEQRRGLCCFPTYPNPISACNFHCRLSPSPTA